VWRTHHECSLGGQNIFYIFVNFITSFIGTTVNDTTIKNAELGVLYEVRERKEEWDGCQVLTRCCVFLSLNVTTDGQLANLSWNKTLIRSLRPDFYYCQTVAGLLLWGTFSDERLGLTFTTAAGPRQRSHSLVRVPWDCYCELFSGLPHNLPSRNVLTLQFIATETWNFVVAMINLTLNKISLSVGDILSTCA
jgi:hypothetical protein